MDPALTAAAIGVGGTVIVGVAGFWANVRNTNKTTALTLQGQVADRYSKAIEQLGSKQLDVRLGGIYALEGIARDSPRDHPTIMEVLAVFIRDHSRERWPSAMPGAESPERTMRPDVQAAITVIGRRTVRYDSQPANLESAQIPSANLIGAHLTFFDPRAEDFAVNLLRARFGRKALSTDPAALNVIRAHLTGWNLTNANLTRAALTSANLTGTDLTSANLAGANLWMADLTYATLTGADLTGADLTDADLTGADLTGAILTDADLTDAKLVRANLTHARWSSDRPVPQGWQLNTDGDRLESAAQASGDAAP